MPNQIQALALLPKLSEQQLLQVLQRNDGSMPSYAVMAELAARKKRSQSAGAAGAQMPTSTVKDDMVSGIQSLGMPPQMQAEPRQFAEGGRVAEIDNTNPFVPWRRHIEEETLRYPWNRGKLQEIDKSARDHVANIRESEAEDRAQRYKALLARRAAPIGLTGDEHYGGNENIPYYPPRRGKAEGGTVGYDDYAEARRRYLESGGQDAPPGPTGWDSIKGWFANHPLLNGSYDAATRPPAAEPQRAPFSDARMSGGYGPGDKAASPRGAEQARAEPKAGSGIRSIKASASVSGKASPGGPGPAGFDFQPIQLRSIKDAMGDVPADGSLAEMIAAYKAQAGDAEGRRKDAANEALIRAGLTMARTPGGLGSSIAAGGIEGLNAYGQGRKEASAVERERMKELAALQQAQSAQALQRYGIANATRFGEAGIADKNQDNRFNAYKTGVESADRRYAADAGVRAASIRAAESGTSPEKYRIDMAKQLRGAVEKARENVSKNGLLALGASPTASPQARMAYERAVEEETLRTVSALTLEYPEILDLYKQMRGGAPGAGPAIIRGNGAPPPGAVVRQ